MVGPKKYILLVLAGCLAMTSCTDEREKGGENYPELRYLQDISVQKARHAVFGAEESTRADDTDPYDGEEIIDTDFIHGQSTLYVSQKTGSVYPFQEDDGTKKTTPTYKYVYYKNQNADWDAGFNFSPAESDYDHDKETNPNALDWDEVGANGPDGNGFSLYAMYYPEEYVRRSNVEKDQSDIENLRKSDIQGAYHSTSALYSRVRFKLFHLMVYIKVNLYVPVFKITEKTEKGKTQPTQQDPSGYSKGDLIDALVMNAFTDFIYDWSLSISSDAAGPTVSSVAPTDLAGFDVNDLSTYVNLPDIKMYSHRKYGDTIENDDSTDPTTPETPETPETPTDPDNTTGNEGDTGDNTGGGDNGGNGNDGGDQNGKVQNLKIWPVKRERVKLTDFLPENMLDMQPMDRDKDGILYDDVYVYSFSAIIPAQYPSFTDQMPGFLRFDFDRYPRPAKRYYFNTNSQGNGEFGPNKGTLQVFNLYLPRKGDEIILINADVKDWSDTETDMNLPKKDDNNKAED